MNPCIDCHALMFSHAGRFMQERSADFLFSGEVLGERRMSQNKHSLEIVARRSGFADSIIRPLSARLLPATKPEQEGLVNREKLLAIEGRSRKPQLALAQKYGITEYPEPAGGCKLTNPDFSMRLRDLLHVQPEVSRRDLELLSLGRHFRIDKTCKIIVGRNEQDNEAIISLSESQDTVLFPRDIPGPVVLIPGGTDERRLVRAASICLRYTRAAGSTAVNVYRNNTSSTLYAEACSDDYSTKCLIQKNPMHY